MQLEEFLKRADYFSLGHLPTEGLHPSTRNLSDQVENDLPGAIRTIQQIDLEAIQKILPLKDSLADLQKQIALTFQSGNRVFLSGCGATGRLALALETTWRQMHRESPLENSVQALMAGGDFALVKSVENFEDFPEFGEHHLTDLGFRDGDLLIAITEGGETPYVIGTLQGALKTSSQNPWFVYCNPTEILCKTVERSRIAIEDPRVHALCINTGPMALSGSTRLQAATAQMLAVGAALIGDLSLIDIFLKEYAKLDIASFLNAAVIWESDVYRSNGVVLYQTSTYPIAILTDTTERSPTFSLTPFEKSNDSSGVNSLCYLMIQDAHDSLQSWKKILNRTPMGLEWPALQGRLGLEAILEFDFGTNVREARQKRVAPKVQHEIRMDGHHALSALELKSEAFDLKLTTPLLKHPLTEQLLVKVLLNTLSLMVMGKIHRYEGNVMTWVRPSNGKLMDRTVRYLEFLIQKRGSKPHTRTELIELVFRTQPNVAPDEAVILKVLASLN